MSSLSSPGSQFLIGLENDNQFSPSSAGAMISVCCSITENISLVASLSSQPESGFFASEIG